MASFLLIWAMIGIAQIYDNVQVVRSSLLAWLGLVFKACLPPTSNADLTNDKRQLAIFQQHSAKVQRHKVNCCEEICSLAKLCNMEM